MFMPSLWFAYILAVFLPFNNSLLEMNKVKIPYTDVSIRKHCANMYLGLFNTGIIGKISQVDHSGSKANITPYCINPYLETSCRVGFRSLRLSICRGLGVQTTTHFKAPEPSCRALVSSPLH